MFGGLGRSFGRLGLIRQGTSEPVVPNDYTASAVHFDGATVLVNNSLSCTDSAHVAWSCWFNLTNENGSTFFGSDPEEEANNIWNIQGTLAESAVNIEVGDYPFVNSIEVTGAYPIDVGNPSIGNFADGQWHHVLFAADTSINPAPWKIYIDGVDRSTSAVEQEDVFVGAFNGLITSFGSESLLAEFACYLGDIADFQLYLGASSMLSGGDIPLAKRRLFIDAGGKPVDPTIAAANLGTPVILFSGNSTGFATNQGSGGAFTVAAGALTSAGTSPSD